jgi:hypothetical protein
VTPLIPKHRLPLPCGEGFFFLFEMCRKFDFFLKKIYNRRGNININIFINIFVRKSNFDNGSGNKKEERD